MLNDDNKLLISGDTVGETFHGLEGRNIRVVVGVPIIEQPGAETSRNERIRDEDLNNYWNAIKVLDEKDLFLKLSNVNILGEQDGTSTLFIRKCYQDLSTVVLNDAIRRIRITGNPGIGKTYFGYYLLYLLAKRGETILYENVARKSSYVFDGEEVFRTYDKIITDLYKSRRDVWYIVDGMEPEKVNAKTILVCSPKKSHYANFDKYSSVTIRYMPEWSLYEIHTCKNEMFPDIDEKRVDTLFSMWGGIPRFVLENADDIVQQQKLMSAVDLCGDKIFDYIGGHDANPEISHTIIHLWTNLPTEEKEKNTDENANNAIEYIEEVPYTKQLYYFASDYVANLVTEKFKQNIMGRLLRDIEGSLLTGTSDQFLGCCFEQIAHRMLREGGNFIARSLEPAFRENEVLHQQFTKQENILTFSKIEDIEESKYYQPEIKNFPSIDAIVAPKVLLQMTTSMTHPIKMVGLDKLYDGNKLAKNEDISFYFVVPAQLYDHYQKQGFVTTKEANVRRFSPWIPQYVKQYALRIDLSGTNIPTGMPPTAGGP
ncbi:unnamed protein product, partial [Rhizophagus irregularis]